MGKYKNIILAVILLASGLLNLYSFGIEVSEGGGRDAIMRLVFGSFFTGLSVTYFRRHRRDSGL